MRVAEHGNPELRRTPRGGGVHVQVHRSKSSDERWSGCAGNAGGSGSGPPGETGTAPTPHGGKYRGGEQAHAASACAGAPVKVGRAYANDISLEGCASKSRVIEARAHVGAHCTGVVGGGGFRWGGLTRSAGM